MLRLALLLIAPGLAAAQVPRVGVIEVYGLRKVPAERVLEALGVAEGDRLPSSKLDVEERLAQLSGVSEARLEAVCCSAGRAILYIGIGERGGRTFRVRKAPAGAEVLPDDTVGPYREFLEAFEEAARAGNTAEDDSEGHPLAAEPNVRRLQERFRAIIPHRISILRRVLRDSADPLHRAIAAAMIGYAPNKQEVAEDLEDALRDPDEGVRANALRALAAMSARPEVRLRVSAIVEMLDSIAWSDRYRAAEALVALTSRRPAAVADLKEAGAALREMARWKTPAHARPAFLMLGRMAGLPEEAIEEAWETDPDSLLKRFGSR